MLSSPISYEGIQAMKTICCCLEKGGSAKTSTAHALGARLAHDGKRVLFVDLDPQGNLSTVLGDSIEMTSGDVLVGEASIDEAIVHKELWDILGADRGNAKVERKIGDELGRESQLKEALEEVEDNYDYVIIDTPPQLGLLTINALTASDWVIIPAQTDIFALEGIANLGKTIKTVQQYSNSNLKIAGVLLTRYNGRTNLAKLASEQAKELAEEIGTSLFETKIREGISIREAQAVGEDIFSYAPKSNPAKDYSAWIDELKTMEVLGNE